MIYVQLKKRAEKKLERRSAIKETTRVVS